MEDKRQIYSKFNYYANEHNETGRRGRQVNKGTGKHGTRNTKLANSKFPGYP